MRRISCCAATRFLPAVAGGLLAWGAAWAQASGGASAEAPAGAAHKSSAVEASAGTIIVGDKETPMGLYLTPWKNVHPDRNLDRPPQLLQEELTPLDPQVFGRRVDYYDKLAALHKLETGAGK